MIQEFRRAGCVDDDSAIGIQIAEILINIIRNFMIKILFVLKKDAKGCFIQFDSWSYCNDNNLISKEIFYPLQKIEFEGDEYYVPNKYIYVLKEVYGEDFYTFPCGEPHFIHADWKKNEKLLEEEVKKRVK